jgi:pimeloyl-ACP methyl ester carboxylesterase
LEIGFDDVGSGPPLIALHGSSGSGRDDFAGRLGVLAAGHRVLLPDARGHASTRWDVTTGGFTAESLIDDLAGFADALGLGTFHLLGFSLGGMTALGFAARAPERLASLVLAGIAPHRQPRAAIVRRLLDPDRIERDDRAWATRLAARHDPSQGVGAWRHLLRAIADDVDVQPFPTAADIRRIDAPTLVACGDRDPVVPVAQAAELARQVRDGRFLVVPARGHDLLTGASEVFDAALVAFYRSVESSERNATPDQLGEAR